MKHALAAPLPFGRLWDVGMREYGEFACSRETAEWLMNGGMTHVDGRAVRLQLVEECTAGNVIVAAREAA